MRKAWIENNRIRDIAPGDPADLYHPDVAKFYDTSVPDNAENGWTLENGIWTAPPAPEQLPEPIPVPTEAPKVSPVEFKLLFTSAERVAIKAARQADPVIDDFYDIVEDPHLTYVDLGLQSTKDAIGYLQSKGLLTAERAAVILTGNVL